MTVEWLQKRIEMRKRKDLFKNFICFYKNLERLSIARPACILEATEVKTSGKNSKYLFISLLAEI